MVLALKNIIDVNVSMTIVCFSIKCTTFEININDAINVYKLFGAILEQCLRKWELC